MPIYTLTFHTLIIFLLLSTELYQDSQTIPCLKCFRTTPVSHSHQSPQQQPVPPYLTIITLPAHPLTPLSIASNIESSMIPTIKNPIRAFLSQIGTISLDQTTITTDSSPSHLLTAGNDQQIRHWDLNTTSKCFIFAGLPITQPKPSFTFIDLSATQNTTSFSNLNENTSTQPSSQFSTPNKETEDDDNTKYTNVPYSPAINLQHTLNSNKKQLLVCHDTSIPSVEVRYNLS